LLSGRECRLFSVLKKAWQKFNNNASPSYTNKKVLTKGPFINHSLSLTIMGFFHYHRPPALPLQGEQEAEIILPKILGGGW